MRVFSQVISGCDRLTVSASQDGILVYNFIELYYNLSFMNQYMEVYMKEMPTDEEYMIKTTQQDGVQAKGQATVCVKCKYIFEEQDPILSAYHFLLKT